MNPRQFPIAWQPHDYLLKNVCLIDPLTRAVVPKVAVRVRNGVPIALGTDAGSPNLGPHPSVAVEMETMVEYGFSCWDVLAAATHGAAMALAHETSLGSVEEGKKADLILLAENPAKDIRAMRSLRRVIKSGILL